jgi:4-amino-4-deoxy-L-arabinose transferase-like glycosyltransferase
VKTLLTACVVVALYLGVGVFDHEVWAPTEPTVAGIVWNMVDGGGLAVPLINGLPYLEKPPLYYWLAWLASRVGGGLGPGALRLPAALLGLLALGAVFWTARRRHGEDVACATVLLGATSFFFWESAHRAGTDIAATSLSFVCFALFARTLPDAERAGAPAAPVPWSRDLAFALVLAISFYAKNFFTFLVVLPPVVLHLILHRRPRRLLALAALVTVSLVILVAPWCLALHEAGGSEYLRIVFFDNTIGRFLSIEDPGFTPGLLNDAFMAERGRPVWLYALRLLALPLPWTPIFLVAIAGLVRKRHALDEFRRFLLITLVTVPVVLTLSSSRNVEYLSPVGFVVLLVVADLLRDLFARSRPVANWERRVVLANLVVVGVAAVALPLVLPFLGASLRGLSLMIPPALGAGWLVRRGRRQGLDGDWWVAFGGATALAMLLALLALIPFMDARKSSRPFFDEVRRLSEGRPVYTTDWGDHRLPLINYYLRRRVHLILEGEPTLELLRGRRPVAVVLTREAYGINREAYDAVPGSFIGPATGRGKFVFIANRASPASPVEAIPSPRQGELQPGGIPSFEDSHE